LRAELKARRAKRRQQREQDRPKAADFPSPTKSALNSGNSADYKISNPTIMSYLRNNSIFTFGRRKRRNSGGKSGLRTRLSKMPANRSESQDPCEPYLATTIRRRFDRLGGP